MLVQADRIFVTASPLSELVWSPRKGLSLKCADSGAAEHKTSLWWNTESFNVIASVPDCSIIGENFENGPLSERTLSSMQFVPSSKCKNEMDVTSPRSAVGIVPACPTRTHERNSTSCGDTERLQEKTEMSIMNTNLEEDEPFEHKETGVSSSGNSGIHAEFIDYVANVASKVSMPDTANGKDTDFLSCKTKQAEADCSKSEKRSSHEHKTDEMLQDNYKPILHECQASDDIMSKCCKLSEKVESAPRPVGNEPVGQNKDNTENGINKEMIPQLTYFHSLGEKCLADVPSSNMEGIPCYQYSSHFNAPVAGGEVVEVGVSEAFNECKDGASNAFLMHKKTEVSSHDHDKYMNSIKGKEKVVDIGEYVSSRKGKEKMHETEENLSILKERGGSLESIKSNKSKGLPIGKRAWCSESEEPLVSKKSKKSSNRNSFSGSFHGQDSSIMKWKSGVAKALLSSAPTETSLSLVPKLPQIITKTSFSPFSFDTKRDIACSSIGFQSFVQALCRPKLRAQQVITSNHGYEKEFNELKALQIENKLSDGSGDHVVEDAKLQLPVPLSSVRPDNIQFGEVSAAAAHTSFGNYSLQEKLNVAKKNHGVCNLESSSSSIQIGPTTLGDKEVGKLDSVMCSSNILVATTGSEFLGSFWITRLCPKPSPLSICGQSNQTISPAAEMQIDGCNMYTPHNQNDNVSFRESRCSESAQISPMKNQMGGMENKEHSASRSDSSSMGITDRKPKTRLNPILPSKRLKKLEPITSVFAKRLGAFRHIKRSSVVDDVIFSTLTCFFCGQTGHRLKECSEIMSSELEELQKNINSYDGPQESACLCIRCFQLNHWAAACPYSSIKTSGSSPNIASLNYGRIEKQPITDERVEKQPITNDGTKNGILHGKSKFEAVQDIGFDDFGAKVHVENHCGESMLRKGKNKLTFSGNGESKGNQMTPVYNFVRRRMVDEQTRIFEGIRGLRVSRTELVRLMNSTSCRFTLDGFFLRVRLGMQEDGIEGTGYQVASISGALQEKMFRNSRNHIPVNIGGLKCLLDCRFVSNNDFIEDELNAWWSKALKAGAKLPTEEELARKLQERKKLSI